MLHNVIKMTVHFSQSRLCLVFGVLSCFSDVQAGVGTAFFNPAPIDYFNFRSGARLEPSLKQKSPDVRNQQFDTVTNESAEPQTNSQQLKRVRIISPSSFKVSAAHLTPLADTACVTEAVAFGDNKLWQCYNKKGQDFDVSIDLSLSQTDESGANIVLPVDQSVTIHYAPFASGVNRPEELLSELYRDDAATMIRATLEEQRLTEENVRKTVQASSSMMRVLLWQPIDDPAIQSIYLKQVVGVLSKEDEGDEGDEGDEKDFQQRRENIFSDNARRQENVNDIVLLPDTLLQLSANGIKFPGVLHNLAEGDGQPDSGGASQQDTKQNSDVGSDTSSDTEESSSEQDHHSSEGQAQSNATAAAATTTENKWKVYAPALGTAAAVYLAGINAVSLTREGLYYRYLSLDDYKARRAYFFISKYGLHWALVPLAGVVAGSYLQAKREKAEGNSQNAGQEQKVTTADIATKVPYVSGAVLAAAIAVPVAIEGAYQLMRIAKKLLRR